MPGNTAKLEGTLVSLLLAAGFLAVRTEKRAASRIDASGHHGAEERERAGPRHPPESRLKFKRAIRRGRPRANT